MDRAVDRIAKKRLKSAKKWLFKIDEIGWCARELDDFLAQKRKGRQQAHSAKRSLIGIFSGSLVSTGAADIDPISGM
jgi:hypothetical protein